MPKRRLKTDYEIQHPVRRTHVVDAPVKYIILLCDYINLINVYFEINCFPDVPNSRGREIQMDNLLVRIQ